MDQKSGIVKRLAEGLVIRRGTVADAERLAEFNSLMHRDPGVEEADRAVRAWTVDIMLGRHPTVPPDDVLIVEDPNTGEIVSSLAHLSQTLTYAGIPVPAAQPEAIATHPNYRRQGLVRAQFEISHQWSVERGELMQLITGIPWYYRQFGYEMALAWSGGRTGYKSQSPQLRPGETEAYAVRPATGQDIPFMSGLYEAGCKRYRVAAPRDEQFWRFELNGHNPASFAQRELRIIETAGGESVGYLSHSSTLWGPSLALRSIEIKPNVPWPALVPVVVRYLCRTGEEYAQQEGREFGAYSFVLGDEHPVFSVSDSLLPRRRPPYAWYVRIGDLPAFLRQVTPALEQNLAISPLSGYTGELLISFYRTGVKLGFENGRIAGIQAWKPESVHDGNASFPDLTFLQLLMGYRSLTDLEYAFADCLVRSDEAGALLAALFPRQPTEIWPLQ